MEWARDEHQGVGRVEESAGQRWKGHKGKEWDGVKELAVGWALG